ncbi:MAG: right-handed parallel beta-helix repeat-containing protein [Prevotella sp.]|nr:right-handed parallel beta-helix repeat-containing protein [Prevotella sp.]
MQKIQYLIIALLCAVAQGAWAQTTNVSNEAELRGAIENGANITLTQDITIGNAITFNDGITVTIDLGGHTLNRNSTSGNRSQVIGVYSSSTLNISNGTLTGGWGGDGGILNQATLNMTNVTISGNKGNDRGGGISNNGTLTMTDCTVSGNTSRDAVDPAGGGGIFNYSGKTATLTNCTITGNTASTYAGGGICNYGTLTLNNCSVTNNSANTTGGGIFNSTSGTLSINGCEITGNIAGGYGDGIYIDNSTLNMQGLCTVTGNNDGNIYLYGSGTKITVTGAFTTGSNIGVGVTDYDRKLTSGFSTYNSGHEPGEFFSMDNAAYAIGEKDGEVCPGVPYWDHSWEGGNTDGHVVYTQKVCTDYSNYSDTEDLNTGWYVLSGSHTYKKRPRCHGEVKFILQDGSDAEFKKGIHIDDGKTLTIYAQSGGTGKLKATGDDGSANNGDAAIGGNNEVIGGYLVIHGGYIYAYPYHNCAAGIGGGDGESGMRGITIWDGTIEAKGRPRSAGIGGGQKNSIVPTVTIYGGSVTAKGGEYGAGIGGGQETNGGTFTIYGGTVTATGSDYGASIGGGIRGNGGSIKIYGGTVNATGGNESAGIGGGSASNSPSLNGDGGTVEIYGGTVNATGGNYYGAGIGGGYNVNWGGNGGTVTINGGTVTATGGYYAAGIGGGKGNGGTVTINGGTVTATGGTLTDSGGEKGAAGIGGGYLGSGADVYIYGGMVTVEGTGGGQAIGRGGNTEYSEGTLTLGTTVSVKSGGSPVNKGSRVSTVRGQGPSILEQCAHGSITGYTDTNDYYHHINCSYCEGEDEHHIKGDGDACTKCGYALPTHAYTLYEAKADGSGYASEGTPYYVTATHEFTFPSCSVVPKKMTFAGWLLSDTEPSGILAQDSEDLIQADSTITVAMVEDRTYYARFREIYFSGGNGTVSDPFLISDTEDWNHLAQAVNDGINFNGMYFVMTNDVGGDLQSPVTKMVGQGSNRFRGNFDGQGYTLTVSYTGITEDYCAPFRHISGATIKNLNTTGTIETSARYAGGVVGYTRYYSKIENCRSSVTIRSSHAGWAGHGGILGLKANVSYSKPTIEGCVFDGKILTTGETATTGGAGIVGYTNGQTLTIKNCLYKPATLGTGETAVACATIYENASSSGAHPVTTVTCTDCFYTEVIGSVQGGTQGYTVESGTEGLTLDYGSATTTYEYDGIKAYSFGLSYGGTLYSGNTQSVTFTPQADEEIKVIRVNGTPLAGNGDGTYTVTMGSENVSITAVLNPYEVELQDTQANTTTITANDDRIADVTITGRTIFKDGSWNTLCLPFDVSATQIAISDHPLNGATIMELDTEGTYDTNKQTGYDATTRTLYLYFKEATKIEAGVPYIVKWTKPDPYTAYDGTNALTCSDIVSPKFPYSEIESHDPETVVSADGKVSFKGNYDPVTLKGGNPSNLYLGVKDGKSALFYPAEGQDRTINSFRAYFHVDLSDDPAPVRAFVLNFGDNDETTGIVNIEHGILNMEHSAGAGWYDLSGRKLQGKPTAKGIYIYKGKKVIK